MSVTGVQQAMQRYFETLGTERFVEAVDSGVTWTVTDTGRVVVGADEVRDHVDALHAAMVGSRPQSLVATRRLVSNGRMRASRGAFSASVGPPLQSLFARSTR